MSFFDVTLINILFIAGPISIYLIFVAYNNNLKRKQKDIILDITCFSIVYLMIKYSTYYNKVSIIFFLNLPLIILYLKKRRLSPLLLSLVIVGFYCYKYNFSPYFLLLEYLVYFVIFDIYKDETKKTLDIFIFLKGITLSIELLYLIPYDGPTYKMILQIFLNLCIFYFVSIVTLKMLQKGEQIVSYNQLLKELEREKDIKNSLFKLTHEVKNPIAVCKGYLSMMDYKDIEKTKKYNQIINSELTRTLDIMDNFSSWTKININKDLMDVNMLIEESIKTMEFIFKEKNITVSYEKNEDIYIEADYERLKQVITNILKNSVEAIKENGKIDINLKRNKNNIIVKIKDNGEGMTKEEIKNITKLFYSSKQKGCGIGVPLSMEIIRLHDGTLKYTSEKNIGTIVEIKIPNTLQSNGTKIDKKFT